MITAMLGLQASRQADASVRDDFDKAIRRIHTLADLHNRLYRDDGFGAVDMRAYLGDICDALRGAVLPEPRIELECQAMPMRLTIDQAVPLGLIVNELATNAAKYAFPGNRTGKLVVRLDSVGDRATLSVADDGVGLPGAPETLGSGIGLGMVNALARQIGGTLTVASDAGTTYSLSFRADLPAT